MSAISLLSQKPLILGAQHFGIGLLSLGVATGVGAGAVQVVGNPNDSSPKVEISVPKYTVHANNAVAPKDVSNNQVEPSGFRALIPWGRPDGSMTPWIPGAIGHTEPQINTDQITPTETAPEPHVTSVAEAATAAPSQASNGNIRILSPNMGATTTLTSNENGVVVTRSGGRQGGGSPLISAPITGVAQQGPNGLLPIVASDGRNPI